MSRSVNGTTDYWRSTTPLVAGPPFTVAGWINTHDPRPTKDGVLWYQGDGTWQRRWKLQLEGSAPGSRGSIRFVSEGPGYTRGNAETAIEVHANVWHHVAGVEVSSNLRHAYLDRTYKATDTVDTDPLGVPHDCLSLGAQAGEPICDQFVGRMAHFAVWGAALTDQEILTLASGFSPMSVRPWAILAYWPLNGRPTEIDPMHRRDMPEFGNPSVAGEPPIFRHTVAPG